MAKKYVDPVFAAYAKTALRLDIEFCLAHHPLDTMPADLAARFAALLALAVQTEAKGKPATTAMRQEYWRVRDVLGAYRAAQAGSDFYASFWPSDESWREFRAFRTAERQAEQDATTTADTADLAVAS